MLNNFSSQRRLSLFCFYVSLSAAIQWVVQLVGILWQLFWYSTTSSWSFDIKLLNANSLDFLENIKYYSLPKKSWFSVPFISSDSFQTLIPKVYFCEVKIRQNSPGPVIAPRHKTTAFIPDGIIALFEVTWEATPIFSSDLDITQRCKHSPFGSDPWRNRWGREH